MTEPIKTDHPELDAMFERYRQSPQGHVFAPLADACRKAGMLDEAIELCRKGVESNPEYASGYVVQGKCLYDAGHSDEAEASFRRVLELDGNNLVALKFLGVIHVDRGDIGAARACFEHILALDPDDREIRRRLKEVEDVSPSEPVVEADARVDDAVPVSAVEAEPGDDGLDDDDTFELPDIEDDFEGPDITLGDAPEAEDDIATTTLADIYAAQGYRDKALRIYREVLRRQPNNEDVRRKIEAVESGRPIASEPEATVSPLPTDLPAPEPLAAAKTNGPDATPSAPEESPVSPEPTASAQPSTPGEPSTSDEPPASTTSSAPEEPATSPEPPASPRPAAPADRGGAIDQSRSYEQFKRWLRSVSD